MKRIVFLSLILVPCLSFVAKLKDVDVESFKENAEVCVHLSGEWDAELPDENKMEIKESMNDVCGKAKKLYPILQWRYKHDVAIKKLLLEYKDIKSYKHWD